MTQHQTAPAAARPPGAVEELKRRLDIDRGVRTLKRSDALQRLNERVGHGIATAQARAEARRERRQRREERRDAAEEAALSELRRRASVAGERARVRARIQQSAEMRALRMERVRRTSLYVLMPVLVAFAAWSTTSVHAGVTRIFHAPEGSPMWVAAWGVEPAIITIVAGVIILRAVLRSSGGDLDKRATVAEWAALSASIALAAAGHWAGWSAGALAVVAVACVGPLGAALTAWLIGIVDDAVTRARPERYASGERVPKLAELQLDGRGSPRGAAQKVPMQAPKLSECDYDRLLSGAGREDAPEEPAASERHERPVSDAVSERRELVAELLAQRPHMTGPQIAEALTAAGRPVSVPTAKRDRAAVTGE